MKKRTKFSASNEGAISRRSNLSDPYKSTGLTGNRLHISAIIQRARKDASTLTHDAVMQLQRTMGNLAVERFFRTFKSQAIQRKPDASLARQLYQPEVDRFMAGVAGTFGLEKEPGVTGPRANGYSYPMAADTPPGSFTPGATQRRVVQRHWNQKWRTLNKVQKQERATVIKYCRKRVYPGTLTAGLNAQLRAGLTAAKANQAARPALGWLDNTQVKVKAGVGQAQDGVGWRLMGNGLHFMTAMYNARRKRDTKWNADYANNEGPLILPGTKGAGGFKEYYAEPTPDAAAWYYANYDNRVVGKYYGQNRLLRQTNVAGKTYWWATADHYRNIYYVSDA